MRTIQEPAQRSPCPREFSVPGKISSTAEASARLLLTDCVENSGGRGSWILSEALFGHGEWRRWVAGPQLATAVVGSGINLASFLGSWMLVAGPD
jgi:hypothetical protein